MLKLFAFKTIMAFFSGQFLYISFIDSKTERLNCMQISPSDSLNDSPGKDTIFFWYFFSNLIQLVEHLAGWRKIWWHPRLAFINYRYSRSHNFIQIHCSRCKIVRWSRWRSLFSDSSFRLAVNHRKRRRNRKLRLHNSASRAILVIVFKSVI